MKSERLRWLLIALVPLLFLAACKDQRDTERNWSENEIRIIAREEVQLEGLRAARK